MKPTPLVLSALAAALLAAGCSNDNNDDAAEIAANVLLAGNQLAFLDVASPADGLVALGAVTGLTAGDTLVSIDRRPQNGFLYGLGYNATAGSVTLYAIHPDTRAATSLGLAGSFVDAGGNPVAIGGGNPATRFEMDFNPAVDRVRVINSLGQNFRMNPNTGAVVDGDLGGAPVAGTNMDGALNTGATAAQGTAYVNNAANNGGITTQYTVDETSDSLYIQNPPNAGTLASGRALSPSLATVLGFDIAPGVTTAAANAAVTAGSGYLLLQTSVGAPEALGRVDLVDGRVRGVVTLAGGAGARGLALQAPASAAVVALSADGGSLVRFAAGSPGTTTTVAVTGVDASETLVGLDFRPATGQLYAFGVNPVDNDGTIYRLDPQLGTATVIGTAGGVAFVDAAGDPVDLPDPAVAGYGVDFNPTVDRIRVTTSTGLNFRLNQLTGAGVDGNAGVAGVNPDGSINGAALGASGAGYTNSVGGATATTLYVIDSVSGRLTLQSPPNDGTQVNPLAIRIGTTPLAFTSVNGFDIPADVRVSTANAAVTSGSGFAALRVGGMTRLYRISLVTGAATDLGMIGSGADLRGLALGQTHAR